LEICNYYLILMSVDQFLLSADTTDLNYPEIRPTLDLNFARVKALDPRITFTRSSGGSYVGADGLIKYAGVNEARFDHDPETGESLGLLVEEARTNLFLRSEEFETGSWSRGGSSITANAIVAPDGTLTGAKLIENNQSRSHQIFQQVTTSAGSFTATFYVKAAERTRCQIRFTEGGSFLTRAVFDLETGRTILQEQGNITNVGNGWYRIEMTATSNGSVTFQVQLWIFESADIGAYQGDGTSGIYVWGAQLEVGAFPTSYIPTLGSTRTRAADNARIIGKNFSEWYRQDEGTVFVKAQTSVSSGSGTRGMFRLVNSSNTLLRMRVSFGSGIVGVLVSDTTTQANFNMGTYIVDTFYNAILKYGENDFASSLNGATPLTDFSGTVPRDLNLLQIGQDGAAATTILNGTISRLTYFPKRLPNAQLQALTR
jgi:hypothetical protein